MPIHSMNGSRYPAPMGNFDAGNINGPPFAATGARSNATRMNPQVMPSTGLQVPPSLGVVGGTASSCAPPAVVANNGVINDGPQAPTNWRLAGEEMRRLRTRHVVLIERMLRNHQPHDVLTQVPENVDWHSKTFTLAIKIERLMFAAATSRENYLNESTLRQRVQMLSRHLVRIRKRKNAVAASFETRV